MVHEGVAIGNWLINSMRPNKDKLFTELVEKLDALGFLWETGRKKRSAVPPSPVLQRDTAPLRKPESSTPSWFGHFELCRVFMRTLSRQIKVTDMYRGVNIGHWFQMESQIYTTEARSAAADARRSCPAGPRARSRRRARWRRGVSPRVPCAARSRGSR